MLLPPSTLSLGSVDLHVPERASLGGQGAPPIDIAALAGTPPTERRAGASFFSLDPRLGVWKPTGGRPGKLLFPAARHI